MLSLLAPEWTWETQPTLEQSTETWEPPLSSEPCKAEQGVFGSLQPSWPFSQSPEILVVSQESSDRIPAVGLPGHRNPQLEIAQWQLTAVLTTLAF